MEFILIGIVIVVFIALMCMLASRTNRSKVSTYSIGRQCRPYAPSARSKRLGAIASLDLTLVRTKVAERHGWDAVRALAAEVEYRQFLKMLAENPGQVISPWSKDLDLFWHEHILDTKRYAEDCERMFGRMIHHDPHITGEPAQHARAVERTNKLRSQNGQAAEASKSGDSSGCTVTTAAMIVACSSSHGHGSGGDHGGSHGGGHSCSSSGHDGGSHGGGDAGGGHSCGGHSCGSSCGGGGGCGGGGD